MSLDEYETGRLISSHDYPFYALIQAAMRQADTDNLEMLKGCWPKVWEELQARYNAPGGRLEGENNESAFPTFNITPTPLRSDK